MSDLRLHQLLPHPSNPSHAISEVVATIRRRGQFLSASFRPIGRRDQIIWPTPMWPAFSDGLWQHTCFEAFVTVPGSTAYLELNMAPSKRWAAYRFDDVRSGMRRASAAPTRRFMWYEMFGTLIARWKLAELPANADWRLGLSAVIELRDGSKNYFALAHAPGPPDFHNSDCFIATLPAPTLP